MYNIYYIPYAIDADINYIYLLYLYGIAKRDQGKRIKSIIEFSTFDELLNKINEKYGKKSISISTLRRFINNKNYNPFFTYSKSNGIHRIELNNVFKKTNNVSFVRIIPDIYNLIIDKRDNLLAKYIIYLIHCCGITNNETDFTANQFLLSCGYSINSNSYHSRLSEYNKLLKDNDIISIACRLEAGNKKRNTYKLLDYTYS